MQITMLRRVCGCVEQDTMRDEPRLDRLNLGTYKPTINVVEHPSPIPCAIHWSIAQVENQMQDGWYDEQGRYTPKGWRESSKGEVYLGG